jgi:ribosomal protein L10
MSAGEMTEIATIPSRQTLYAQFVNLINSPIQQFVMAVDQIAQKQEA